MEIDPSKIQVYINCGGKSGSKTLEKTLRQYYRCLHTHGNFYFQQYVLKNNSKTLYDCIQESMNSFKKVFVIDVYRTPLERAISSCFQNKPNTTIEDFNYNLLIGENYSCMEEILFELNLPRIHKFDFEKKYNLIIHKNLHIIKIRFQDINEWDQILSNIFKQEILIIPDNLSINKSYYEKYKYVLNNLPIPTTYFTCLINTNEFKLYNSSEEVTNYILKWKPQIKDIQVDIPNLPSDFYWVTYVKLNGGRLEWMNELEVSIHYAQTGRIEGKKYK